MEIEWVLALVILAGMIGLGLFLAFFGTFLE